MHLRVEIQSGLIKKSLCLLLRDRDHFAAAVLIREERRFRLASPHAVPLHRGVGPATEQ